MIEKKLKERQTDINKWFESQWQKVSPPLYGSVDLRNAGFKIAPVDMNLFPAGFNNLSPEFLSRAVTAAKETILERLPEAKSILLIPEDHTRNLFYSKNVEVLVDILKQAGFIIKTSSLDALKREGNVIKIDQGIPDLILLNNDLSAGMPDILQNLQQPIFPPAELGWHQRLKSEHFHYYATLSQEFAQMLDIDPWLITPLFRPCGEIDFLRREGIDCIIEHTRVLLEDIQKKYNEYQVSCKPFVIIKADAGTQGMAVMTIRNIDELRVLNRKKRTSMATSKGGMPVRRVIIQEGVYTFERDESQNVAEPVIYLWGKQVVGGFYRMHEARGPDENLNTPGMYFESYPFDRHLYTYGAIAQLSMLAAAKEIAEMQT